jgi:hypothetical protein
VTSQQNYRHEEVQKQSEVLDEKITERGEADTQAGDHRRFEQRRYTWRHK